MAIPNKGILKYLGQGGRKKNRLRRKNEQVVGKVSGDSEAQILKLSSGLECLGKPGPGPPVLC